MNYATLVGIAQNKSVHFRNIVHNVRISEMKDSGNSVSRLECAHDSENTLGETVSSEVCLHTVRGDINYAVIGDLLVEETNIVCGGRVFGITSFAPLQVAWLLTTVLPSHSFGLNRKFIQVFHNILWKSPNELFGQASNISNYYGFLHSVSAYSWL